MARIEVTEDPRQVVLRDPQTGDALKETTLSEAAHGSPGCAVKVNGITSAYCDGPGKPVNVIRVGLSAVKGEIVAAVQEHYGAKVAPRVAVIEGVKGE